MNEKITILDFGSQYSQLIARRIREIGVYSELLPFDTKPEIFMDNSLKGLILSGSPESVLETDSPEIDKTVFEPGVPILGICYGMQLIAKHFNGELARSRLREYGQAKLTIDTGCKLFASIPETSIVWMSHGDNIERIPIGFHSIAHSDTLPIAAIANESIRIYGTQFHPEVKHTEYGMKIIQNFVRSICKCKSTFDLSNYAQQKINEISQKVGPEEKVILAYSGGVDSTVVAAILIRAIENRLVPIFIGNGLLRKNEAEEVKKNFQGIFGFELKYIDASMEFLSRLEDVENPEQKRKIIGNTFIEIFKKEAKNIPNARWLAQGTLYPDVIESVSFKGPSTTIKTHHNVGGLPEKLGFKLIEPLRELFKDEVRELGKTLDIPHSVLFRHPFPGPGLAVRILGAVSQQSLNILRDADAIFIEELKNSGEYDNVWQALAVLLPIKTVGVMGDERTYENVISLRAVNSTDGMTADWSRLPYELLAKISSRIVNEVKGVNRVVYDISSKPPATIEWE